MFTDLYLNACPSKNMVKITYHLALMRKEMFKNEDKAKHCMQCI